ncbi:MAG: FMN-binding negative transcriptional regulator [Ferruginibacter sp.]
MYKLPHFTEHDNERVFSFMKENSFAVVTGIGEQYPVASHLPLEIIEENGKLIFSGHLMRKTAHHTAFEKNNNVLVIFHSTPAYINAAWYKEPEQASTVNYMAVHAKGKIFFTDEAGTYAAIKQITDKHIGTESPASFDKLSKDYVAAMLKAIIGFKIEVDVIENVFKLSQNRDEEERKNIIEHLEKKTAVGLHFIADEMKKRLS